MANRKGLSDFFVRALRLTSPYLSMSRSVLKLCLELTQAHNYFDKCCPELNQIQKFLKEGQASDYDKIILCATTL